MMRRLDLPSLVGGLGLLGVGLFLLLDSVDSIVLTAGWTASMILAAGGATLLATGIVEERRRGR